MMLHNNEEQPSPRLPVQQLLIHKSFSLPSLNPSRLWLRSAFSSPIFLCHCFLERFLSSTLTRSSHRWLALTGGSSRPPRKNTGAGEPQTGQQGLANTPFEVTFSQEESKTKIFLLAVFQILKIDQKKMAATEHGAPLQAVFQSSQPHPASRRSHPKILRAAGIRFFSNFLPHGDSSCHYLEGCGNYFSVVKVPVILFSLVPLSHIRWQY